MTMIQPNDVNTPGWDYDENEIDIDYGSFDDEVFDEADDEYETGDDADDADDDETGDDWGDETPENVPTATIPTPMPAPTAAQVKTPENVLLDALNAAAVATEPDPTYTVPEAHKTAIQSALRAIRSAEVRTTTVANWVIDAEYPRPLIKSIMAVVSAPVVAQPKVTPPETVLAWRLDILDRARAALIKEAGQEVHKLAAAVRDAEGYALPEKVKDRVPKVLTAVRTGTSGKGSGGQGGGSGVVRRDVAGMILDVLTSSSESRMTFEDVKARVGASGGSTDGALYGRFDDLLLANDDASKRNKGATGRLYQAGIRAHKDENGQRYFHKVN